MAALRVFAALWLVGFHLALAGLLDPIAMPATLRDAFRSGFAMTSLFIMLSGFMMYFAYTDAEGALRTSARELWIGRVARLWPIMMLGHALSLPMALGGAVHYSALGAVGRGVLVTTALQAWVPKWALSFNGPAWTLSVLAFCYALLPWIVRLLARRSTPQLVALLGATWVLMLLPTTIHFASLPTGFTSASNAPDSLAEIALHTFPLLRLPEFVAGAILARLFVRRGARASGVLAAVGIGAGVLAVVILGMPRSLPDRLVANGLLSPLFWLLILGVASAPRWVERVASRLKLDTLGDASLGVFMLHLPPLLALQVLYQQGRLSDTTVALVVPAFVLSMLAASWVLEIHFVRPVAARVKAALGARLLPPRPASVPAIAIRRSGEPPTGSSPRPRTKAA